MSFYEGRRGRREYGDVNEALAKQPHGAPSQDTQQDTQDWSQQRRARPSEALLPMALRLFRALPADVRPQALVVHFPRVANLIALQWNDRGACPAYFDSLLIDTRPGRQGFPAPVRAELLALREHWYHERAK